jgi:DNA polymerase III delta prime subunit
MHQEIVETLNVYYKKGQVPNILFFGPFGSGKTHLVQYFIKLLFSGEKKVADDYSLWVNCAFGKGIKFIRENLKNFAKTNVCEDVPFKIIVLQNAEKLTSDAQSALRRCIEDYSHNTRFIIITSNKNLLMPPILSRFSEIYVPLQTDFHKRNVLKAFPITQLERDQQHRLRGLLNRRPPTPAEMAAFVDDLVSEAYSAADLAEYVETDARLTTTEKYEWLMRYTKIKGDFRSEALLMAVLLQHLFSPSDFRPESNLLTPM